MTLRGITTLRPFSVVLAQYKLASPQIADEKAAWIKSAEATAMLWFSSQPVTHHDQLSLMGSFPLRRGKG
jgi:hypothetical protein